MAAPTHPPQRLNGSTHPPTSLASELVGHITREDNATSKDKSQQIKNPFSRMLPPTLSPPHKNGPWTLKRQWHSPLTLTPFTPQVLE